MSNMDKEKNEGKITKELIEILKEYIDFKYGKASEYTGISGNNYVNRQIVKEKANIEDFLDFLQYKYGDL